MLKLIRQYKGWILAIGGTLLLITFLVPQAITEFSQYSARTGTTWATVGAGNRKLTAGDLDDVRLELRVVDSLQSPILRQFGADRDPAHWYLLTREAEEAGLVGSDAEGRNVLDAIATQFGQDPDTALFQLAQRSGTTPDTVLRALAKLNGVIRLTALATGIGRTSDRRLALAASDALRGAACDLVVLDATTLTKPEVAEPSEAALQAQFDRYRDVEPGAGERGFGYKLPDRCKLEWIEIPEAAVRTAIAASGALDSLALKKRFAADPAKYGAPATGNAPFADFEEAVRTRTLDELTAERMAEIAKFAADQLALPLRGLPRENGYISLPADWDARRLALPALADTLADRYAIALPAYRAVGETWLTGSDLDGITGLGVATTDRFGPTPLRLSGLVAKLREFGKGDDTIATQLGVALPPLAAGNKDVFLARVTAVDPSRPPQDLDEIRGKVIDDVRAIERFAALEAAREAILAQARTEGPRAVANAYGTTVEFVPTLREADPRLIGFGLKFGGDLPGLGNRPETVREISRAASRLPTDRPIAEVPAAERTFLVPVPDRMSMVLVRVDDLFPLTLEEYRPLAANGRVHQTLLDENPAEDIVETYGFEALRKRHNFRLNTGDDAAEPVVTAAPANGRAS